MIRVLHVIDHLGLGGGQKSIKNIVENMHSDKFLNIVCALRPVNKAIKIKAEVVTLNYGKWNPFVFFAFMKLCRGKKIDIIHSHTRKATVFSLLACYFCSAAVIVHERGAIFQKGLTNSIYRLLLRMFQGKASKLIANSQTTSNEILRILPKSKSRIFAIRNAVDYTEFDNCEISYNQAREMLGVTSNDIILGYAGRLHYVKGVDILLNAVALLVRQSVNYVLVLAGDGRQRASLERLAGKLQIKGNVKFSGTYDNVSEIMAACDIAVVPSRYDAFGRVALEFMRMKVPLVCSGRDGLAELVEDGVTALVPPENTAEEIARAVKLLVKNKQLRQKLIDNAYEFSKQFSISEHVSQIENIYREVLGSGG